MTVERADTPLTPAADVASQSDKGAEGRVSEPAVNGSVSRPGGHARCGAKRRQGGGPCGRPAGWATSHPGYGHCRDHGGASPGGVKYAARLALAEQARSTLGPVEIEPMDSLAVVLADVNGRRLFIQRQREAIASGEPVDLEMLDVYLRLEDDTLDRQARFSKLLIDAGHDERQVVIAESYMEIVAGVIRSVIADLGLLETPEQRRRAAEVLARHLPQLNAGPSDPAGGRELAT